MNGSYLLDTNIIIAIFAGEKSVLDGLSTAEQVFIPIIAIGEMYFGAYKSARLAENLSRLDEFISNNGVLNCDAETARYYGEIKEALRIKGRPIPENDIWIAAIAIQHSLTLVTRDQHFNEIDKLSAVNW